MSAPDEFWLIASLIAALTLAVLMSFATATLLIQRRKPRDSKVEAMLAQMARADARRGKLLR